MSAFMSRFDQSHGFQKKGYTVTPLKTNEFVPLKRDHFNIGKKHLNQPLKISGDFSVRFAGGVLPKRPEAFRRLQGYFYLGNR